MKRYLQFVNYETGETELKSQLAAATDAPAVERAAAEYDKHKLAMDEGDQVAVEVALSQARDRVEELVK